LARFRRPAVATTVGMTALVAAFAVPAYGDDVASMAAKLTKQDGKKIVKVLPKNSITGNQVKESTLGKVRRSAKADTATKALSADTAAKATTADTAAKAAQADTAAKATTADTAVKAAAADNADKLDGKDSTAFAAANLVTRVSAKLSFGEDRQLVANGPVSLHAQCIADEAGASVLRVYSKTTEANSFQDGSNDFSGGSLPGDFLQPDTMPVDATVWSIDQATTNTEPRVQNHIDSGFVAAASGPMISGNGEEVLLGLHAFGADCAILARVALDTVG
jgi:hypothetical protein